MLLKRKLQFLTLIGTLLAGNAFASVLPDDRSDVLYHRYEGGGVLIDGPSVLVRKKVGKNVSVVGNYYIDYVSSASIDVVTTASPYNEERTQWSLGVDYLRGNTTLRANYVSSVESDYDASTAAFSVSQDMFGQLTTLTLSYGYGDDVVGRSDDPTFERFVKRQQYSLGITQILTKNMIAALNVQTTTEEGYLNNPYRQVRFLDPTADIGYSYEGELYPNTRTANAVGIRARYFLPYRAALEAEYRFFVDTWDIESNTISLTYIQPWRNFTFKVKGRYHDQTGAHFYRDLFSRSEATNFRGRDKELSPLQSYVVTLKGSYKFIDENKGWGMFKKATVTASIDMMRFEYEDFRDLRFAAPVGQEPLYQLDANVVQVFVSFWY
ncbi:MAG: DUF3570 domain-containing protein [Pseudomonadota bacterium]